ncbi:MAG: AAA family ATPase [Trueperaceae bacterium]|nr:AAA family ATPase [Trueperaceae bacterium]
MHRKTVGAVRDDEIRGRLREQNPWWRTRATARSADAWRDDDPVLRARSRWDLGYRSELLDDVVASPGTDLLIILRGPRRVGKSVLLRDTAASLCQRPGFDPLRLISFACDGMNARDLRRAILLGQASTRAVEPETRVWFLDEVAGIRGWTETLKYLRDTTSFAGDTVVCTGSSWDPQAEVERDLLAGRAGTGPGRRERILHPMSYREFLSATRRDIPSTPLLSPGDLQRPQVADLATDLEPFLTDLDLAWQDYLTCGGFPRAVAEHHRDGQVSESFLADLSSWLHRDVDAEGPPDSVPLLLAELHRRSAAPLNRRATAATLGYPNPSAFERRLDRLTAAFATLWCPQVDERGRRVAGAQSKVYLADPVLAWLSPARRSGIPDPDMTVLSEAAVAVALARSVDRSDPGRWSTQDAIGYLKTTAGGEIDLAPVPFRTASGTARTTPIESKWVSARWRREARAIEARFAAGILATKDVLDFEHPAWALPAPLVALFLE